MNNTFSIKRFRYLFREIALENKWFFIGLFVIIGIVQLLFGLSMTGSSLFPFSQSVRLFFGAFVGTIALSSVLHKRYQKTAFGMRNLLLPASITEKWLVMLLFSWVLFWAVYLLVFWVIDFYLLSLIHKTVETNAEKMEFVKSLKPYSIFSFQTWSVIIVNSFLGIFILTTATYLKKNAVSLSILLLFGVLYLLITFNWGIGNALFPGFIGFSDTIPFSKVIVAITTEANKTTRNFEVAFDPTTSGSLLLKFMLPISTIWLAIIYFFRLKETEI